MYEVKWNVHISLSLIPRWEVYDTLLPTQPSNCILDIQGLDLPHDRPQKKVGKVEAIHPFPLAETWLKPSFLRGRGQSNQSSSPLEGHADTWEAGPVPSHGLCEPYLTRPAWGAGWEIMQHVCPKPLSALEKTGVSSSLGKGEVKKTEMWFFINNLKGKWNGKENPEGKSQLWNQTLLPSLTSELSAACFSSRGAVGLPPLSLALEQYAPVYSWVASFSLELDQAL